MSVKVYMTNYSKNKYGQNFEFVNKLKKCPCCKYKNFNFMNNCGISTITDEKTNETKKYEIIGLECGRCKMHLHFRCEFEINL